MVGWVCSQCGPLAPEQVSIYREGEIFNAHSLKVGPWCRQCGERVLFDGNDLPFAAARQGVLLLSGTCASGKSTLSYLLARQYGAVQIDGDWITHLRQAELGRKVDFNEIHNEMLVLAEGFVRLGKTVVIAHVILPEAMVIYHDFFTSHKIPYMAAVLMPAESSVLEWNLNRKCWPKTTPEYWVKKFYDDLKGGPASFQELFYNSTGETPERTASVLWERFCFLVSTR